MHTETKLTGMLMLGYLQAVKTDKQKGGMKGR